MRKIPRKTLVDISHVSTDPLPPHLIPPRLRGVHPVAASVGYRLAKGNWDRVHIAESDDDRHTVIVL